jgi:hypothetical protein
MIEKFRVVKLSGMIKVKYKSGDGSIKYWTADQSVLLEQILSVLREYSAMNIRLTNRQLYYQLVAGDMIPNAVEIYKRICTFLTDARYGGYIDWESIEDRGRVPSMPLEFNDIKERMELALNNYRLKRWSDQEYYVELYCEKQAMESVFKPVAQKYHIFFGYNKGYSSASTMYDLAQRVKEQIVNGKICIILYAGDHDASGKDMIRDVRERITEFLTCGDDPVQELLNDNYDAYDYVDISNNFQVVPIALNMIQIKKYNPPSNPAKITDPRAKNYIKEFGNVSWELDALKPNVLMKIAEDNIQNYLDVDKYNAWIKKEEKDMITLRKISDKVLKERKE